ncbi:hypothetical protein F5Y04DRAFT_209145 [Hypomontagnella monticulosa]|nr:hypothetical protein F5Y04DRAFT_209145 [Hypomontagnella monticulosa]
MLASSESLFPLEALSQGDLANVCEVLWGWRPCKDWIRGRNCQQRSNANDCICRRADILAPFFDFYKNVTASYLPELTSGSIPALRTHKDLLTVIKSIKSSPDKSRSDLTKEHFGLCARSAFQIPPSNDQSRAFGLAVRVMTMIPCSLENQLEGLLETGLLPAVWRSDQSFNEFIHTTIPRGYDVTFESGIDIPPNMSLPLGCITAKRLEKDGKLKIVPTDNLRDHLLLDEMNGTVAVYHYTSVLKQHLMASPNPETCGGSNLSIDHYEAVPRQLALETLDTLRHIIFPIEREPQSILRSLIIREKFDPDNNCIDTIFLQHPNGEPIRYEYWGTRLWRLHEELEHPTPRGTVENWLERRSGSRYIMLVTLLGVLIAILLGALSLSVSIFQAWVSWQQWRHPIS